MKRMIPEEWTAGDLRKILNSHVEKQLYMLWREPGNPSTWLMRAFVLFILLIDSRQRIHHKLDV